MKYYLHSEHTLFLIAYSDYAVSEILKNAEDCAVGTIRLGDDIVVVCREKECEPTKEFARRPWIDTLWDPDSPHSIGYFGPWQIAGSEE